MNPAARQLLDLFHRVASRGVDHIRGPEGFRQLELRRELVDRDDSTGTRDLGAVDRAEPDTPATDHRDGRPGLHPGRAQHRPDTGRDATADQRRAVERHVFAHLHDCVLVDQHLLRERREMGELLHGFPVQREPRRLIGLARRRTPPASVREAGQTVVTMPTEDGEARDDVIARLHVLDVGAHGLHHPGGLVAQDARHRERIGSLDEVKVAVTDAGEGSPDPNLLAVQVRDRHVFDVQGLADFVQHGCFHGVPSSRRRAAGLAMGTIVSCCNPWGSVSASAAEDP